MLYNKICYNCMRKTECYSEAEAKNLKPGETYKSKTGYDCGVTYTNYAELRKFVEVIGEAISKRGTKTQDSIMIYIAERYNLPVYNVRLEFEKSGRSIGEVGDDHIILCTFPDDDCYSCKWFVVEADWFVGWIQEEHDGELNEEELQEAIELFLSNYDWGQAQRAYQNAKSWGAVISEGHDK